MFAGRILSRRVTLSSQNLTAGMGDAWGLNPSTLKSLSWLPPHPLTPPRTCTHSLGSHCALCSVSLPRKQRRSSLSSTRPGRRSCGGRKPSGWNGKHSRSGAQPESPGFPVWKSKPWGSVHSGCGTNLCRLTQAAKLWPWPLEIEALKNRSQGQGTLPRHCR